MRKLLNFKNIEKNKFNLKLLLNMSIYNKKKDKKKGKKSKFTILYDDSDTSNIVDINYDLDLQKAIETSKSEIENYDISLAIIKSNHQELNIDINKKLLIETDTKKELEVLLTYDIDNETRRSIEESLLSKDLNYDYDYDYDYESDF